MNKGIGHIRSNDSCVIMLNEVTALLILKTGPEVMELFPCSTQLSTKVILLINFKRPTIVGNC